MPNDDFDGCKACMNCAFRNEFYTKDGKIWCDLWHGFSDEFSSCDAYKEENKNV